MMQDMCRYGGLGQLSSQQTSMTRDVERFKTMDDDTKKCGDDVKMDTQLRVQ